MGEGRGRERERERERAKRRLLFYQNHYMHTHKCMKKNTHTSIEHMKEELNKKAAKGMKSMVAFFMAKKKK